MGKTCCLSGHRPQGLPWGYNEADARCRALKRSLSEEIRRAANEGFTEFLCGMALGIDLYGAEAVLELSNEGAGVSLHAVLPCPDQSSRWRNEDKTRYLRLLSRASFKTVISPFYTPSCMLGRNRFMVDNSELLIAALCGNSFSGGTQFTMNYAKMKGLEIRRIDIDC